MNTLSVLADPCFSGLSQDISPSMPWPSRPVSFIADGTARSCHPKSGATEALVPESSGKRHAEACLKVESTMTYQAHGNRPPPSL